MHVCVTVLLAGKPAAASSASYLEAGPIRRCRSATSTLAGHGDEDPRVESHPQSALEFIVCRPVPRPKGGEKNRTGPSVLWALNQLLEDVGVEVWIQAYEGDTGLDLVDA